jgi:hypothetical protein
LGALLDGFPASENEGFDSRERTPHDLGHFLVTDIPFAAKQDGNALILGQLIDCLFKALKEFLMCQFLVGWPSTVVRGIQTLGWPLPIRGLIQ